MSICSRLSRSSSHSKKWFEPQSWQAITTPLTPWGENTLRIAARSSQVRLDVTPLLGREVDGLVLSRRPSRIVHAHLLIVVNEAEGLESLGVLDARLLADGAGAFAYPWRGGLAFLRHCWASAAIFVSIVSVMST